jgi:DNA-directed RNA polymerase subunit RPC12/RpoP
MNEEVVKELTQTLIDLGVTWYPGNLAKKLVERGYGKINNTKLNALGHWDYYSTTMMECNRCKKHVPKHRYKYCPECGSKMIPKVKATLDNTEGCEQLTIFDIE